VVDVTALVTESWFVVLVRSDIALVCPVPGGRCRGVTENDVEPGTPTLEAVGYFHSTLSRCWFVHVAARLACREEAAARQAQLADVTEPVDEVEVEETTDVEGGHLHREGPRCRGFRRGRGDHRALRSRTDQVVPARRTSSGMRSLRRCGRSARTPSSPSRSTRCGAYLKQIGKVALLNAEEKAQLAKRIKAGLYAAERVRRAEDVTDKLSPQLRRDLRSIVRGGPAPRTICWRPIAAGRVGGQALHRPPRPDS
jgi:sigma-70-like protein